MLIQGRTPKQVQWMAHPERWPVIYSSHPSIFQTFLPLRDFIDVVCRIEFDFHPQSLAIHGLGHLCAEDFLEILVLEEQKMHHGSQKLSRGLFERMITAEVLAEDPEEAQRFFDYYHLNLDKVVRRSKMAFGEQSPLENVSDQERLSQIKQQFRSKSCDHCGNTVPKGWSVKSLETHANEVGKRLAALYGDNGDPNAHRALCLSGADLCNPFIHASMFGIFERLMPGTKEDSATFQESFTNHGALEQAESWLIMALQTQDRFFKLGFDHQLQALHQQLHDAILKDYASRGVSSGIN